LADLKRSDSLAYTTTSGRRCLPVAAPRFSKEVPIMSTYAKFLAAEVSPAAFTAVPAGLAALAVVRDHDIAGTQMTNVFGQARRPRKIPL
jgi:hypothetical protein